MDSVREVDFLPQWYQESRRRQSSVKRQYIALAVMFLIMVIWNAVAVRSVSLATAELAHTEPQAIEARQICGQFDHLVRQLATCQEGLRQMQALEGRLDLASVLAELSVLMDGPLVVETLEVTAEKGGEVSGPQGAGVAPVRFPVTIKGVAQDAPAVAAMLKRMETSVYFQHVNLVISRNPASADEAGTVRRPGQGLLPVAFEIRCLLATEQRPGND